MTEQQANLALVQVGWAAVLWTLFQILLQDTYHSSFNMINMIFQSVHEKNMCYF